jgi:hypothetical protein
LTIVPFALCARSARQKFAAMENRPAKELSVIQKAHDLILWYVPLLNRLPRDQKFALGDRIISNLYALLEGLILARYARERHSLNRSTDMFPVL